MKAAAASASFLSGTSRKASSRAPSAKEGFVSMCQSEPRGRALETTGFPCAIPGKEYNNWQAMSRMMEPSEFSVPPALARRVEKLARQERRTPAALLREMLRLYERHKQEQAEEPYTEEWALRLMQEAQEEERLHPMAEEDEEREEELQRYGAAQAKKLGIKSDKDIERLIHEHRQEKREKAARAGSSRAASAPRGMRINP